MSSGSNTGPPPTGSEPSSSITATPQQNPPMLIVGAGPVGLSLGLGLALHGVPSILIEAHGREDEAFRVGSRAICFQRDVLDIFDRLGVASPLLAEGVTWTTARTYYREHEVRTVSFDPPPASTTSTPAATATLLPPWINISQARVHEELLRASDAEPLIQLRERHELTGLQQDATGVTAETLGPDGHSHSLYGSHLVGADGARSAVRRLLGINFPGESFTDRFLICDIRAQLPFPQERRFYFDPDWNPGRQVLVHQCPEGTWRIDWQVPANYDLEAERASGGLDKRIRKIVGSRPYELVWTSVYRFHQRCAERFHQGRVFLAGDAAHLFAPFGARGLNSGVQDADNLAWKLAAVRAGWSVAGNTEIAEAAETTETVEAAGTRATSMLLASYATERWAAAQENLRVTSATMRFLVPQDAVQRQHRQEVLRRSVTDPDARDRIDSGTLAEPHPYTDSQLTTRPANFSANHPAAPAEGTQQPLEPGSILPDGVCQPPEFGEPCRLRWLLRGTFTVLLPDTRHVRRHSAALAEHTHGPPVRVRALSELDPGGQLATHLGLSTGYVYVVRPDAHVCAVVADHDPDAVRAALLRACGEGQPALAGTRQPSRG